MESETTMMMTMAEESSSQYKMAELRYEAPLATFDMDEWNEFLDLEEAEAEGDDIDNHPSRNSYPSGGGGGGGGGGAMENSFDETFSGSLEDLVNSFDDKIIKCFKNYAEQAEVIAPVQVRSQDDSSVNESSQTWWTLTGNFGGILPIDWSQLYATRLNDNDDDKSTVNNNNTLDNRSSEIEINGDDLNASDVEQEQFNHSNSKSEDDDFTDDAVTSDDQIVTADQVIHEIEGMLEGDIKSSSEGRRRRIYPFSSKLIQLTHPGVKFIDKADLKKLSFGCLSELRDELHQSIQDHSEVLIEELAVRDELDYEKELKNHFIWLLLNVQKRRREVMVAAAHRTKPKFIGNGYLTTVIPYQASKDPLAVEKLQIYIQILSAINDDSCSVPSLLTDYILRVLCPTT